MKPLLKLKFVDFWTDLDRPDNNYFYELLSEKYDIEFSNDPDVVFYSCYGSLHLTYNCTRIFYSAENHRPDFSKCDYAITFDYLDSSRHVRMPLWAMYYISYARKGLAQKYLALNEEDRFQEWSNRKNFCCMMVASDFAKERIVFYDMLNDRKTVDSAGMWNNTIGRKILPGTENKFDFIKDYRFVISFENKSNSGYATEKIIESLMAGCIPIYWGDPEIERDFNGKRFISVSSEDQFQSAIETILNIEKNKNIARPILSQPIFSRDQLPACLEYNYLSSRLLAWLEEAKQNRFKGVGNRPSAKLKFYSDLSIQRIKKIKQSIMSRLTQSTSTS